MRTEGFPKSEKLKQKKEITALFENGKWKSCGKIRIIFLPDTGCEMPKIGVSAPKRNFKKAVDRNRIKRLLREAYRRNKPVFTETFGNGFGMLFWTSTAMPENFNDVQQELLALCQSVKKK